MRLFKIFILVCVLCSCGESYMSDNKVYINLDVAQNLPVNKLFQDVELIQLDTNKRSLFGKIKKMCLTDSFMYIQDVLQEVVLVFDNKGQFVHKLNKNGRGPQEYVLLGDFTVSPYNNHIFIADRRFILEYDRNNSLIKRTRFLPKEHNYLQHLEFVNDSVLVGTSIADDMGYHIFDLRNGKLLKSQELFPRKANRYFTTGFRELHRANGIVTFMKPYSNDVYHVKTDGFHKAYEFDFGNYNFNYTEHLPGDISNNSILDKIDYYMENFATPIYYVLENSDYVFTSFAHKSRPYTAVFSKKTRKYIVLNKELSYLFMRPGICFDEDNRLVLLIDAKYLRNFIDEFSDENQELISKVKISDNPLLLKLRLNDNLFN